MATTIPANPTPQTVSQLLSKITDADPDFRFMALNDLLTVFTIAKLDFLNHDYNTAARTVDHVVRALDDQNGEVQNQAIKWYDQLRSLSWRAPAVANIVVL
jgi:cullin-associated NEDD8-dissociated protein 1